MTMKKLEKIVVRQDWEESESGWGVRPDGCSLHKDLRNCENYKKEYWDKMPKDHVPFEYSRESGRPYNISVPVWLFQEIITKKNGLRLYQYELHKGKYGKLNLQDPTEEINPVR